MQNTNIDNIIQVVGMYNFNKGKVAILRKMDLSENPELSQELTRAETMLEIMEPEMDSFKMEGFCF